MNVKAEEVSCKGCVSLDAMKEVAALQRGGQSNSLAELTNAVRVERRRETLGQELGDGLVLAAARLENTEAQKATSENVVPGWVSPVSILDSHVQSINAFIWNEAAGGIGGLT